MNTGIEYWTRVFKFYSIDELNKFELSIKPFLDSQKQLNEKVEKRGSKTKEFHNKVREYIKNNPDVKYRDALKNYKNIVK